MIILICSSIIGLAGRCVHVDESWRLMVALIVEKGESRGIRGPADLRNAPWFGGLVVPDWHLVPMTESSCGLLTGIRSPGFR